LILYRQIDGLNYEIWAGSFGRNDPNTLGSNVGKEPNYLDAYSDINDPNTWSKITPEVDGMSVLDNRHLREFQRDAAERFYGREKLVYGKEEREAA